MKTKKVTVSVLQILVFILVISIIIASSILVINKIKASKNNNVSSQGEKSEFFSGMGTEESPYLIQSATDLANISKSVNNGKNYTQRYFKLMNDIDLAESEITPIGLAKDESHQNTFSGIFDGNNKTIMGLKVTAEAELRTANTAIFENNNGIIKNLRIIGNIEISENLSNELNMSLLCTNNYGTIQNCKVEGTINGKVSDDANASKVSALVSQNLGDILDSSSFVNITTNLSKAGICNINEGNITNCSNLGIIMEEDLSLNYTSGIVCNNAGTISNCTNSAKIQGYLASGVAGASSGNVIASQNKGEVVNVFVSDETVETRSCVAGICILLDSNATIENCRNSGEITGTEIIAGLCGTNNGKVVNSTNETKASKKENAKNKNVDISGICAINNDMSLIDTCTNSADITAINNGKQTINIATIGANITKNVTIQNCTNSGKLTSEGKNIQVSDDAGDNITGCANSGRGAIEPTGDATVNVGMIFGNINKEE